ncbi:MAG: hypothetical protein RLZZ142_136 [Verrucomicrobiota bacterium]
MNPRFSRPVPFWRPVVWALLGSAWFPASPTAHAAATPPTPQQIEFFEQKIRPVLSDKCFKCHSSESEKVKAGLLLDSREGWIKGGDNGPALDLAAPDKSLALQAIRYTDKDMLMPPEKSGGKLPEPVIADFERWIREGAPWPEEKKTGKTLARFDLQERKSKLWCWKPPVSTPPPAVRDAAWPASHLDRFILAALEKNHLQPAPKADPAALLRRLSFDLTGLPPTPAETQAFLADPSPRAFSEAVERLLASPHFGERWARHWMDLTRYAEGRGHEFDHPIPNAWQYRDYLIRAFNADVPYHQFLKEHVAGDLLPKPRLNPATGANESILATGFYFLGEEVHSPVDIRQDETDRIDNRIDTLTKSFLGLTVACARCHDHKFDAISQKDYYALAGFLISSGNRQARFETMESERKLAEQLEQNRQAAQKTLLPALAAASADTLPKVRALLLAARACFLSAPKGAAPEAIPASVVQSVAEQHRLNPAQLQAWIRELDEARKLPAHPLHLFALTCLASESNDSAQLTGKVHQLLEKLGSQFPAADLPKDALVRADYRVPNATPFLQDGSAFGPGSARPGDLRLGSRPESPFAGIVSFGSACRQELWKKIVPKGEAEPGSLKAVPRSGQSLRTPEFTLQNGKLWYLVKGAGKAYAPVDSHLMIGGPLHGKLITSWKATNDWQWVSQDLSAYSGHRVHVELVPDGPGEFEVALVVESAEAPAFQPTARALHAIAALLVPTSDLSAESLAQSLQSTLEKTAAALRSDSLGSHPDLLPLADWMSREIDLLCPHDSPDRRSLSEAAKPWIEKARTLAQAFPAESHTALAMFDGTGVDEFLLRRGSSKAPQAAVPRRFLEALAGPEPMAIARGSGRLELAEQMADAHNPLTSRVIVNRVWHHLFGRGIVPTVDNFGELGQRPSHPELLDRLALDFTRKHQWSLKSLIRELVHTSTYQMTAKPGDAAAEKADPQNLLWHRMNLKRLEGEAIRDALLTASGRLDPTLGGPSIPVFITPFMEGRGRPAGGPLDGNGRRSVYLAIKRNFLSPMMLAFDMPIPFQTVGKRNVSNVPAQSLVLMNDPFVVSQAQLLAKSLPEALSPEKKIASIYLRAFARAPLPEETQAALQFLQEAAPESANPKDASAPWADLCHILFNTKEFIHLY